MPTEEKPTPRDYLAELLVAGLFAADGWNIYFPHRDQGFDFVASFRLGDGSFILRPVQVKGKYPKESKTDKAIYGYNGPCSARHPEMVLAIPFFAPGDSTSPVHVAYMPSAAIRPAKRGVRCCPASYKDRRAQPRRDFERFFNRPGLRLLRRADWKDLTPEKSA
jgi:hypothetical protein